MNIWYLCKYVSKPGNGYVGMRSFYLMKELSNLGFNIDLITSSSSAFLNNTSYKKLDIISPSFTFHQIKGVKFAKASSFLRILSWLEFELKFFFFKKSDLRKPHVIVVSSLSFLSIVNGLFWKKIYSSKLIFEIRDIWPLTLVEEGGYSKSNPFIIFLSFLERLGYNSSDLIIGTMPNLKSHVFEVTNKNTSKVICIPMGIPDASEDLFFRSDYTLVTGNKNFVIGYVGTIGITNALETLFSALKKIDMAAMKIECHIAGDGPLLEEYKKKYSSMSNLKFLGHIDKKNVSEVMSSFDIVYFSTFKSKVWDYGQSLNKIIDYMLSGKPILGSYSGFPSMINEAKCGWFIEAENSDSLAKKIIEISNIDKQNLILLGNNGREWIKKNRKYSLMANYLKHEILELKIKGNNKHEKS